MTIWRQTTTLEDLNARFTKDNVNGLLDIRITEIGPDFLCGEMPVDGRHVQPFGIIHGGVSVVLTETLGSLASVMCCDPGFGAVGVEVNANHLRPVPRGGTVLGRCTPVRLGRTIHVWNIELRRAQDGELSCVSRLTTMIVDRKGGA